jgi:MFS family permease
MGRYKTFSLAGILVLANAAAQVALMVLAPPARMLQDSKNKKETTATVFGSFRTMFANREVMAVAGAIFGVHAVLGVVKPLSQVVLDREFGMAIVQRSLVITVATAAYLIGTPVAGFLSDRMSRPKLVGISLLLAALSTLAFALRGLFGIAMFHLCMGCLGLSLAWNGSVAQALLADLVDRHRLGNYSMAFALADMADSLGLIIGPILGLGVSQVMGPNFGVGLMGCLCLLMAPFVFAIKPSGDEKNIRR